MSIINNGLLLASEAAAAGGYTVSRSLRFNAPDSAFLSRTPGSAGNRKTFTWSAWVKRASIGSSYEILFSARAGTSGNRDYLTFQSDQLVLTCVNSSGTTTANIQTTALFRDPAAWYHLALAVDTTQATAANRVRMYVNGTEITVFSLASYPSQNTDLSYNDAQPHTIGQSATGTAFSFSGYLAEIHFIDGQALTPSSFTEVSATTGQLVPKQYSGSYGTNGFKLTFSDNSGTTSATLGKDSSGLGNNFTPNNFSVATGAGNDSLVDTPTSYGTDTSAGGEVRGNYATLNPLNAAHTYSNGNLDVTYSTAGISSIPPAVSSIGVSSGKWYCEYTITNTGANQLIGITSLPGATGFIGSNSSSFAYYTGDGNKYTNNSGSAYGASSTTNDVIGIAFDADSGKVWFSKNGTWQASGNPASGTNAAFSSIAAGVYFFGAHKDSGSTNTGSGVWNFGARAFSYTAPSGFKALCDTNLPTPVVAKPSTVFDIKLYTGNGGSQTISGLGFSPDLAWVKSRSNSDSPSMVDRVRGDNTYLLTNSTNAEATQANSLVFTNDGFTAATGLVNTNNYTYVSWLWDAGSSNSTNTQGSITSTVRANASAGFSVVTYTGNGTAGATIGHGLGTTPSLIITKSRNNSSNWAVQHASLGGTTVLWLNLTNAQFANSSYWNNTNPTSTVFTVGNTNEVNISTWTYVAYCFAPVANYSAFGTWTGNGSADGPFIWTGFRPRFIIMKDINSTNNWQMLDTARDTYNVASTRLFPNQSVAETSATTCFDFLSNGFKARNQFTTSESNITYIYGAWAENPFQYARAR